MHPPLKYLPVHWVNGMKISREHFRQQELSFYDQMRDYACFTLNDHNYGLLPATGTQHYPDIRLQTADESKLKVQVHACRAITRGGARIEVMETGSDDAVLLETTYALKDQTQLLLDVIITVNPYERVPSGQPDPEESPLRYPFTRADCKLEIVPASATEHTHQGAYHLTIAKIRIMGNERKLLEQYVPPCTRMEAHPRLSLFLRECHEQCNMIYQNAWLLYQKTDAHHQHDTRYNAVKAFCQATAQFLAGQLDELSLVLAAQPPVVFVLLFKKFARHLHLQLKCMDNTSSSFLLQHMASTTGISTEAFESTLARMAELDFHHHNISDAAEVIETFVAQINQMYDSMLQADATPKAEEKKETPLPPPKPKVHESLFIREESDNHKPRKKGSWFS